MAVTIVFDIKTIPDVAGLRRLHHLDPTLSDADVADYAFQRSRARSGSDLLPPYLQRIIVISCLLRDEAGLSVFSLSEPELQEPALIQAFFDRIAEVPVRLVSWSGSASSIPVLNHRALLHGLSAAAYWVTGPESGRSSFASFAAGIQDGNPGQHIDLVATLAPGQPSADVRLPDLARVLGYPDAPEHEAGAVMQDFVDGRQQQIRDRCERSVVLAYLLWLRFRQLTGQSSGSERNDEQRLLKEYLHRKDGSHWQDFVQCAAI